MTVKKTAWDYKREQANKAGGKNHIQFSGYKRFNKRMTWLEIPINISSDPSNKGRGAIPGGAIRVNRGYSVGSAWRRIDMQVFAHMTFNRQRDWMIAIAKEEGWLAADWAL